MMNISYVPANQEFAKATADFLLQRPMLKILLALSRVACIIILLGFSLLAYAHAVTLHSLIYAIMAVGWLILYKQINYQTIRLVTNFRDISKIPYEFNIDKKRIFYKNTSASTQVEWKTIKFIIDTYAGYIIPLSGIHNSGRFLWLPKRAFADRGQEQEFLQLMTNLKKPLKKIK